MADRNNEIKLKITGDADLSAARTGLAQDFKRIESDASDTAKDIEQAFGRVKPEIKVDLGKARADMAAFTSKVGDVDVAVHAKTTELEQAFDLAAKLDGFVAQLDVNADLSELNEADRLARSLRSFTAKIGLSVDGTAELRDALGLAEKLDTIRQVKVDVAGRVELERANQLADSLEQRRTVKVDVEVDDSALAGLEDQFASAGSGAGGSFADAFGGLDLGDATSSIGSEISGLAGGLAGPIGIAAGILGATFGESIIEGVSEALSSGKNDVIRAISSGLDADTLRRTGDQAGAAYAGGFGDSLRTLKADADLLESTLGGVGSSLELGSALKQAEALQEVFGIEVADSVRLVQRLVNQGLVPDITSGFNLIGEAAQKYGLDQADLLDTLTEQSSTFDQLGISGSRAVFLIGEAYRSGLIPQLDQTGELFEEFVTGLNTGGAKEAIEELGLNWDTLQAKLQSGEGDQAVAEVVAKLLGIPDPAARAAAAVELFGENLSLSADKDALLRLIGTTAEFREIAPVATDAAAALENSRTEFDKLQRSVGDASGSVAEFLSLGLNVKIAEWTADVARLAGAFESVAIKLGVGADLNAVYADSSDQVFEATVKAADGVNELGDGAEESGGQVKSLEQQMKDLDEALAVFSGRFDTDNVFRSIVEDAIAATEATKGLTSANFDAVAGFDISTEAGRKAEAAMQSLSGNLETLTEGYRAGTVSAPDFASGQADIESAVRQVARQMGLTKGETDALIAKYAAVPKDIQTTVNLQDNASDGLFGIKAKLDAIKSKTVTVTTVASGSGLQRLATGGRAAQGLALVGEEGPELVDFRGGGAFVYTASQTTQILKGFGADPLSVNVTTPPAAAVAPTGPRVNIEKLVVDRSVDLWQQLDLAELVYAP